MKNQIVLILVRFGALFGALTLVACGEMLQSDEAEEMGQEKARSLDGVKLISSALPDGLDPQTYSQRVYSVGSGSRLLLRFETFTQYVARISPGSPVRIRVHLTLPQQTEAARDSLRLCPLTRNWMLAATWAKAHPYKNGGWSVPGGDFVPEDCVAVDDPAVEAERDRMDSSDKPGALDPCAENEAICFTVNRWFESYVVDRGVNLGHILIAEKDSTFQLYGDAAGTRAPHILFVESPKSGLPRTSAAE